jgi:hypothetical protein
MNIKCVLLGGFVAVLATIGAVDSASAQTDAAEIHRARDSHRIRQTLKHSKTPGRRTTGW